MARTMLFYSATNAALVMLLCSASVTGDDGQSDAQYEGQRMDNASDLQELCFAFSNSGAGAVQVPRSHAIVRLRRVLLFLLRYPVLLAATVADWRL